MSEDQKENNYSPGHSWYYKLGGKVPSLKAIYQEVQVSGYKGYLEETIKSHAGNSTKLRSMRNEALTSLWKNVSVYRQYALKLHRFRRSDQKIEDMPICDDVHMSISLKHNHIYNDFAHLIYIDELLSYQPDLFDLL